MPEPEDTINNPGTTGADGADNQVTETAVADANNPAGTEVAEGAENTTVNEGGQDSPEDSFLDPKTKEYLDEQIAANPDLKPNLDDLRKHLQGDYTRKRQAESKRIKELEAEATLAKQIQGDPKLVELIQKYKTGNLNLTPPEKKEVAGDILEEAMKDYSPEEKMLLGRFIPAVEKMIERAITPLRTVTETTVEKTAKADLSVDPEFADVDMNDYWPDAIEAKKKYPTMSFADALRFALGQDFKNVSSILKQSGKEDALKETSKTGPAKKKAGFVAGGSGTGADKTQTDEKDDADLTPEEFRKKHGLKIVE